jgi:hypothetical protein
MFTVSSGVRDERTVAASRRRLTVLLMSGIKKDGPSPLRWIGGLNDMIFDASVFHDPA